MKIMATESKVVEVVKDVICDKCGLPARDLSLPRSKYDVSHATLYADWGYSSHSDGESFNFDICENCFYDIVETFMHKQGSRDPRSLPIEG